MLYINGQEAGAIVMPQRGIDEWLSTGFSNMLRIKLKEGVNELEPTTRDRQYERHCQHGAAAICTHYQAITNEAYRNPVRHPLLLG